MNKMLSVPAVRSFYEALTAHAMAQARIALPILEHDLAGWLPGCQKQQALDVAQVIRRRSFLRLSVLDQLHALELVLDDEIVALVMSVTVWPLDARALWVIRHELSVLRNAIGAVLDEMETRALLRTGRRTHDRFVPSDC